MDKHKHVDEPIHIPVQLDLGSDPALERMEMVKKQLRLTGWKPIDERGKEVKRGAGTHPTTR